MASSLTPWASLEGGPARAHLTAVVVVMRMTSWCTRPTGMMESQRERGVTTSLRRSKASLYRTVHRCNLVSLTTRAWWPMTNKRRWVTVCLLTNPLHYNEVGHCVLVKKPIRSFVLIEGSSFCFLFALPSVQICSLCISLSIITHCSLCCVSCSITSLLCALSLCLIKQHHLTCHLRHVADRWIWHSRKPPAQRCPMNSCAVSVMKL